MAFSTRRQEVLEARRGGGLEAGVIATLATRSAKEHGVDRDALLGQWQERAWALVSTSSAWSAMHARDQH